jgi:hypothetical protein
LYIENRQVSPPPHEPLLTEQPKAETLELKIINERAATKGRMNKTWDSFIYL